MSIRMFVSKMIEWHSDEHEMCINYLRVWVWQLNDDWMFIGCSLNTYCMSMFDRMIIIWQSDTHSMTIGWALVTHWMRVIYSMTIGWQLDAHRMTIQWWLNTHRLKTYVSNDNWMTIGCVLNTHWMSIVGFMCTGWQPDDDSMFIVWQSNTHQGLLFWVWSLYDDYILIEWQFNHHTFIIEYWMTIGYSSGHHYLMMSIQWQSSVHKMHMVFFYKNFAAHNENVMCEIYTRFFL